MSSKALDLTRDEVTGDDTTSTAVDDDDVKHLVAGVHLHRALTDLAAQCRVSTEEELLPRLTTCVECTRDLCTPEGAVVEKAAVFASERHTLSDALVDDAISHFGQTIDVCFASTVVTTLDRIVEEAVDGVTIVLVVLSGIDTPLSSDRVCTTGRVLDTEVQDVEAHLSERGSSGGSSQARTDDDDVEAALVCRVDELLMVLIGGPLLGQWAGGDLRIYLRHNLRGMDSLLVG